MWKPIHLVPPNTRIDFMRWHRLTFAIAVVMTLGSIGLFFTKGLNFGIDFAGGILMEVRAPQQPDLADLRERLGHLGIGEVSLQTFGEPDVVLIRLPEQEGGEKAQQTAIAKVRGELGSNWDYRRTETVGPKVGSELVWNAVVAATLAMVGIFGYVWIRYAWQFGMNALIAMFHDVVTTVGLFSLLGLQFDLATVAAILTVAGYSVNDKVVVFDRIRFEMRRYKTMSMTDIVNLSINETLSRTTVTAGLTLISVIALFLFGGEVLRGFAIALIWGISIGTYSTICIAAPALLGLRNSKIRDNTPGAKDSGKGAVDRA
ncbi:MAG TPA: protein translocase subunit SecF [Dongiaceae bacterium]|jgi:preprotein translocase SecF subunit|nr:protein translocase subunit SecF [Dongiaceae bacterium]HSE73613.1 protein translocase subunit SecF [Dongiaceae bacterium]